MKIKRLDMVGNNNLMHSPEVKIKNSKARMKKIDIWVKENSFKHLCQCGCNQFIIIKRYYHWLSAGIPKYIQGHWYHIKKLGFKKNNVPWNKGVKIQSNTGKTHFKKGQIPWNKNIFGDKYKNWQGGISFEPYTYEFNNGLKLKIRTRDNFECQNCRMNEEKHLKKYKRKLDIHHINYNKKHCKEKNLISLCLSCNAKANNNRDYWYAYYNYIIKENK